jgi:hypothetical protein
MEFLQYCYAAALFYYPASYMFGHISQHGNIADLCKPHENSPYLRQAGLPLGGGCRKCKEYPQQALLICDIKK